MIHKKLITLLVVLVLYSCNKKKDILKVDDTAIYKIAGNNVPMIKDFEFKNLPTYKKDSLYLNVAYVKFDSTHVKDTIQSKHSINQSLNYLYVYKFELGASIPTEINYYLNNNSEDNLFVFDEQYKGVPFYLKFNKTGKKIIAYVTYQLKLEQIKNSDKLHNIESYSIYVDTIEVK